MKSKQTILIKSKSYEETTDRVLEWLAADGWEFIRINEDNPILSIELMLNNQNADHPAVHLKFKNGKVVNSEDIKCFWARRGRFKLDWDWTSIKEKIGHLLTYRGSLYEELEKEWTTLECFLMNTFADKENGLSNPAKEDFNKPEVLKLAASTGLKIPPTIITNQKSVLEEYAGNLITKALSEAVSMQLEGEELYALTKRLETTETEKLNDSFFPSYFQHGIDKDFEVRAFYLNGGFYAMAIFSQLDGQTMDDFRAYNTEKPNRNVPFILPEEIRDKLITLMQILELNTASVDLIVDRSGEYYFLEVNPVGQFGMVSEPCNYYLEKKVAEHLAS
ncbi:MAG: grasp-with-spasm system ATP-grasp peptide maturase [Cyclobacteriaceae bacterium]